MNFEPTQVNTVEENASDFITKVNTLFAQNNVLDKDGNPARLQAYAGSPTWLFALAYGQNTTEWQERLRKAYYSLDIEKCDDEQVQTLATLAGVLIEDQSAPMITLQVTNPSTTEAITLDSASCYATDSFGENRWYPGISYTIVAEETQAVVFYCADKEGSVPKDTVFTLHSTTEEFDDITIVCENGSIVLSQGETTADLRNRILLGSQSFDQITQAQNAIKNLNGIVKCSIYFNPDANIPMELPGNIELPPRMSFICIQGVDADSILAYTYFRYVNVQSVQLQDSNVSETVIGASQVFAYYSNAVEVHPKIKVYISPDQNVINTYADYIKNIIMENESTLSIGEALTAQRVCAWIDKGNKYGTLITVEVSADGTTWEDVYQPSVFEVAVLREEDIVFEEVPL